MNRSQQKSKSSQPINNKKVRLDARPLLIRFNQMLKSEKAATAEYAGTSM
jgi:hypothetical protein